MRGVATDSTLWAALYQYASADQSDPEMWVRNQSISLGGSSIALTSGPSTAGKRLYHLALLARLPQRTLRPFLGAQHCPYGPSAALCVAAPAPTVCCGTVLVAVVVAYSIFSKGGLVPVSSSVSSLVVGPRAISGPVVGFCGVRFPGPAAAPLVSSLVSSVLASGRSVVSGCAVGADALSVSAAVSAGAGGRLGVFCAYGPSGAGRVGQSSSPASALLPVLSSGGRVVFWAGGGPSVSPVARLVRRSLAFVSAVAASGPGRGVVAFVGGPPPAAFGAPGTSGWPSCGSGSWGSAGAAALRGVPVLVFPLASWPAGVALPALPGPAGVWVPAASSGPWSGGWRWSVGA